MKVTQRSRRFVGLLLVIAVCLVSFVHAQPSASAFDRTLYYEIIGSEDLAAIDGQIALLDKSDLKNKDAFAGALIMKRAGLLSGIPAKIKTFKAGRVKLEAAITRENNNAELRFLRLMIQENAPGILGYNDDLEKDKDFIKAHFSNIPEPARQVIRDYSRKSKTLSPSDF